MSRALFTHFSTAAYRLLSLLEFFLILRLLLVLLKASPNALIVHVYYAFTDIFTYPFQYGFPNIPIGGGFVLDSATLFAMIGYALALYVIMQAIRIFYHLS